MDHRCMIAIRTPEQAQVVRDTGCEVLAEYPQQLLVDCTKAQLEALEEAGLEVTRLKRPAILVSGASFEFGAALDAEASAPTAPDPNRTAYYLVQLIGPAKGEWLERIRALGGAIQSNLQGYTLLIGILPTRVPELRQEPWVEAITPYRPAMKVSYRLRPGIGRALGVAELASVDVEGGQPESQEQVEISVFPGEGTASVAAQVRAGGGLVLAETDRTVTAVVPRHIISGLAEEQGVEAIVPHRFPKFHNDVAAGIMDAPANRTFGNLTLRGTDQIVAVADSGLDTGNAATIHDDFAGRIVSIVSQPNTMGAFCTDPAPYDDGAADLNSGHGTHVAGSVLANGAAASAAGSPHSPQGTAPEARLYFQAIEQVVNWKTAAQLIAEGLPVPPFWPWAARGLYGLPDDLNDLFNAAYLAGARIHTNSWGADNAGLYNASSRQVDEFMWNHRDMLILFSAGNEGLDQDGVGGGGNGVIDEDSINTPATAKNCLTVGATENLRPHGSAPPPGYDFDWDQWTGAGGVIRWPRLDAAGHLSDRADGMAAFSSRGPTDDGRRKPDLVAPGTNVLSVRSSVVGADPLWGDVAAGDPLHDLYCWSGGTSMSTPLVAGAAALVRQHLVQQRGHFQDGVKPSGALIKAFLINGAEAISPGQFLADTIGVPPNPATDEIPDEPNNVDGFGRANLTETLIPGRLGMTLFADEPDYAVASGQTRTFEVHAIDTGQPLKATLVWTDAPGPVNVGGIENELYLRVRTPGGAIEDGDITAYPTVTNNVQQVTIDAPVAGAYEVEVHGWNVTRQAPGASGGPDPRQDFALVVSNGMGLSLQPVSIAQAIDTTGSMDTFGYMDPAKERAGQLLDFMRINDRLSITEFSQRAGVPDARTPYAMRLLGSVDPDWDEAHTAIDSLFGSGRTPIGAGLLQAYIELTAAPSSQPRALVLLSDGQNNEPPDPDTVLPAIPSDIPIFTIALGPACSEAVLRNIADSRPNGGYYAVESDEDVHKLHEIYAQIQALAAGDALVGLASAASESGSEADHALPVERGVKEVTFGLSWDPAAGVEKMELLVRGPDGQGYNARQPATIERRGRGHHMVRVSVPKHGKWYLQVKNHGSAKPVPYTLSGAVHAPLRLSTGAPRVGEQHMVLTARLHLGDKPWNDAHVLARVTMPTVSRAAILKKYGDDIRQIELPDAVMEDGLDEKQILNLKLAVFAQRFRSTEGGLYGRQTTEYVMTLQADGVWVAEVPITAPGHAQIEIVAEGHLDGAAWERRATGSAYLPEPAPVRPKLQIGDIIVRRNSLWGYTILGARVLDANGQVATPAEGVTVTMTVSQGLRRVSSGDLPYYRRGQYYIWRLDLQKHHLKHDRATVAVQAKLRGATVAVTSKVVRI